MSKHPLAAATVLFLATACGGGGDAKPDAKPDDAKAAAGPNEAEAGEAKAPEASPEPEAKAPQEAAPELTEGKLTVKLGDEEKVFDQLEAKSNFVMATNMGILATNDAGETFKITGMGVTIPPDAKFPYTLENEDPQAYMKHHKLVLAGKAERRLQGNLALTYTDPAGNEWFAITDPKIEVTAYDGGKLVGTFAATTFKPKKGGDGLELTGGSLEVQMMTPAAGRVVEKAVAGK